MEFSKYNISNQKRINVTPFGSNENKKFKSATKLSMNKNSHVSATATAAAMPAPVGDIMQKQRMTLPIFKSRARIKEVVTKNPTTILIGETACGKTTQVPQYLLEAGICGKQIIAITQPRRVAAITIAQRVAAERRKPLGTQVGYAVRFEDVTSQETKLKFVTDGLLLREAMLDPMLLAYKVIILDEAHERTIATDVLFGVVKSAQQKRAKFGNPLKIIVMSATMDVDSMRAYLSTKGCEPVPVVWVEGRVHEVEVHHTVKHHEDYLEACLCTLFKIHRDTSPNEGILVFLTGQDEIEAMAKSIPKLVREDGGLPLDVLPLYAALPQDKQAAAFRPAAPGRRKVVLATNVAETSVTIVGIRHVIDSGMVKARTHLPGTGIDVLKVQRISQAQAWQRTGRAGREDHGACYRCYTKQEFGKMKPVSEPEILRVNLTTVVLQLLTIGVTNIAQFDFMDKPSPEGMQDAVDQLRSLGALQGPQPALQGPQPGQELRLSSLGTKMARFPLDSRLARVLLASTELGCREEVLSLVAVLSCEGVLLSSSTKPDKSSQARFYSASGDHITLLNVYRAFLASTQPKAFCTEHQLSLRALQQAVKVREQLAEMCEGEEMAPSSCGSDLELVLRCLLVGFFQNVATHQGSKSYHTVVRQQAVTLHPSSVLFLSASPPACVLYSELVQTSRGFLRLVSAVEPQWLAEANPEFARRHKLPASC